MRRHPRPLTVSVAEASELTGFSEHAIRRAVRDEVVPSIKVGRLIRIARLPLLRLLGAETPLEEHDREQ